MYIPFNEGCGRGGKGGQETQKIRAKKKLERPRRCSGGRKLKRGLAIPKQKSKTSWIRKLKPGLGVRSAGRKSSREKRVSRKKRTGKQDPPRGHVLDTGKVADVTVDREGQEGGPPALREV